MWAERGRDDETGALHKDLLNRCLVKELHDSYAITRLASHECVRCDELTVRKIVFFFATLCSDWVPIVIQIDICQVRGETSN